MTDEDGEEVPYLGGAKGGAYYFPLPPVVMEVNHADCRPEEHLEQIPSVLLAGE